MREMEQRAYSFLGRDPVLCMDMLEALRRGDCSVYAVSEEGTLIRERNSRAFMLAAENSEAGERLVMGLKKPVQLAVHGSAEAALFQELFHYNQVMECQAAAYLDPEPPFVPSRYGVRELDESFAGEILAAFPDEFDEVEIAQRLQSGAMHGSFTAGELTGLIGIYPEGGIGMLAVRPDQDWEKTAGALAGHITGWCLRQCFAPFVHIPRWDQPLLGLYQKLGYTVSEKPLYWLGDGPEEQDPSQEL